LTPAFDAGETAQLLAERLPRKLPVSVRISNRAKGVVLRLLPGRGLEVVAPAGIGAALLVQAVDSRREWIAAVCDRLAAEGGLPDQGIRAPRPQRLVLSAFNRQWRLSYLAKDRAGCAISVRGPNALVVSGAVGDGAAVSAALTGFCRARGGELLRGALADVSREAALPYAGVSIRAQRTRWGSCTAKGRISLNYTIAFLPWALCRLVLLHELCHTVELNHSHRFWALLEHHVPGCRELDAKLNTARHYLPLWLEQTPTDALP
jgi:predicted metal-dependent hydrolase